MSIASPVAAPFVASSRTANSTKPLMLLVRAVFAQMAAAALAANQRRAMDEIGRYVERNGGMLTDSVERQIGNRFGRV